MRRPSGHFLYPAARAYELVYQDPHLLEIDRTAQERVETMLPHMMEVAGATEELKACNPMALGGADEHAESAGGGSVVAGISLYLILGIDEAGILQASKQSRLYLIYFPVFLTAGIPMAIGRIVF